jgi:hypothetical protein
MFSSIGHSILSFVTVVLVVGIFGCFAAACEQTGPVNAPRYSVCPPDHELSRTEGPPACVIAAGTGIPGMAYDR